jgi:Tfp pilus assembly protein PilN
VWKEFGRWVFAFHLGGRLAYCQATAISSPAPDEALVREIQLAQIQLALQGIEFDPVCVEVWTHEELDTSALSAAFRRVVAANPRPAPVLPSPRSKLLPADVRAARREAARRRNIILAAAAVVLGYLGLIGYLGYNVWQVKAETSRLQQRARTLAPDKGDFDLFMARWQEIEQGVALEHSPLELLYQIARSIPPGSGLRLKSTEVSPNQINISGEAGQMAAVNQFSLAINRSKELKAFKWQTPSPTESKGIWTFTYSGVRGGPEVPQ